LKKVLTIAFVLLVIALAATTVMANPNWRFEIQATGENAQDITEYNEELGEEVVIGTDWVTLNTLGREYIGVKDDALDGKDQYDIAAAGTQTPAVRMFTLRPDFQVGSTGTEFSVDYRAAYTNSTKVWNNWYIMLKGNSTLTRSHVTINWKAGTDSWAPPAGKYTLVDVTTGMNYDMMANNGEGSFTFSTLDGEGGPNYPAVRELMFLCTVGAEENAFAPIRSPKFTTSDTYGSRNAVSHSSPTIGAD